MIKETIGEWLRKKGFHKTNGWVFYLGDYRVFLMENHLRATEGAWRNQSLILYSDPDLFKKIKEVVG